MGWKRASNGTGFGNFAFFELAEIASQGENRLKQLMADLIVGRRDGGDMGDPAGMVISNLIKFIE